MITMGTLPFMKEPRQAFLLQEAGLPMKLSKASPSMRHSLRRAGRYVYGADYPAEMAIQDQILIQVYEARQVEFCLKDVDLSELDRQCADWDKAADHVYYDQLQAQVEHQLHLYEAGLKNARQLIVADPLECVSLIHIQPESSSAFVYQRSALIDVLKYDVAFLCGVFSTSWTITMRVGSLHLVGEIHATGDKTEEGLGL